jgi:hypothetical protein
MIRPLADVAPPPPYEDPAVLTFAAGVIALLALAGALVYLIRRSRR